MPADYFPNYHATLLYRAAPKDFSRRALLFQVVRANIVVDLNQKDEWLHFDNSAFLAGVEHVEALWASIEAGDECMANFARLTHTVQDFYSHSNWVELHQHLSPLPVWDMNIASLPAGTVSGTYRSGGAPKLDDPHARRAEQGQPVSLVLTVRLPGRGRRAEPREDTFRTGLRCGSGRHAVAVRTVDARNLFRIRGLPPGESRRRRQQLAVVIERSADGDLHRSRTILQRSGRYAKVEGNSRGA